MGGVRLFTRKTMPIRIRYIFIPYIESPNEDETLQRFADGNPSHGKTRGQKKTGWQYIGIATPFSGGDE
jgi:hypothetical protein